MFMGLNATFNNISAISLRFLKNVSIVRLKQNGPTVLELDFLAYGFVFSVDGIWTDTLYIIFLVPDSCWATVRNGNKISPDLTEDTIKKRLEWHTFLLLSDNLAVVLGFFFGIAGYIQSIYVHCRNKIHLHPLGNRTEKIAKGCLFYLLQIKVILYVNVRPWILFLYFFFK